MEFFFLGIILLILILVLSMVYKDDFKRDHSKFMNKELSNFEESIYGRRFMGGSVLVLFILGFLITFILIKCNVV